MKPKLILLTLGIALLAGAAGWFAARWFAAPPSPGAATDPAGGRRILFYQSAMHPWIKSDHPGKCTICGMGLTPVFEGDAGFGVDPGLVTLSSNAVTVLQVQSAEVRTGPLVRTLRVAGTIEDDDTRHRFLSAYVGGRIEDLFVNYVGAEVAAGQPLARFYSPMLLEAERQFLAVARSSPAGAALAGEPELLLDAATARLRQLGLSDAQIAALPSKHPTNHFSEILAPMAGTVVNRFVYAGQYVMEGEKLFELADFSTMWFRFDAYEQDLPWLSLGQDVAITTPALPGRTFHAPIRFIDPNLVDRTRSAKVRVEIPNPLVDDQGEPRRLLRHRLYAEGRVTLAAPEVTLLPRSAVLSPAGDPVVYLDQGGGAYRQRAVTLGRQGDHDYEVLAGLAPGERIVLAGNLMIDAQAQLNQAIGASPHPPSDASPPPANAPATAERTPLTPAQAAATATFLRSADALRTALAADDLAGFNAAAAALHGGLETWLGALGDAPDWLALARATANHAHLAAARDLRAARKLYHPFANALVTLAGALRAAQPDFQGLKIYQCPMTAEAFDGAPARAQWLQLAPPLRNPWFGAEMLECGVEVRP